MDENKLSMLRYALKQCEKSYRDARDNPRHWEQAFLNSDGLLDKLAHLPEAERVAWEQKLNDWLPEMKAGANRTVGDRILRRINDSLASAADKLAKGSDPSYEFERLERELAHPDTVDCVPEVERTRAAQALQALQVTLDQKAAEHRLTAVLERLTCAEEQLVELETAMAQDADRSNAHLARVVTGNFDTAQAEIDGLPVSDAEHGPLTLRLQQLRQRFEAL